MSDEKEVRPRRAPYKRQESAAEQTSLRATQRAQRRRGETDRCFQPSHRPQLPMSTERELRPRRAPVKYYESDDDSPQRTRPGPTARRAATDRRYQRLEYLKRYRATHRIQRAESDRRYRERHRERIRENHKRYRERHPERIREKDKRYFQANQERIRARQRQYRERCREELKEKKQRYRENHREELREKLQRYRENHREELREKQRQRRTRRRREADPELVREQNRIRRARFRAKKRMEKLMKLTIPLTDCRRPVTDCRAKKRMENLRTLTIPLTDCRISMPVTDYVQAFCDSLDSGDTPLPESFLQLLEEDGPLPESFLQLLEEDGPTRLDSETMQGSEPSDLDDLSCLQDLLSPDEWEQVRDDVSDFNVEDFVADWLEDMPSSDEGVDLMYDLVS